MGEDAQATEERLSALEKWQRQQTTAHVMARPLADFCAAGSLEFFARADHVHSAREMLEKYTSDTGIFTFDSDDFDGDEWTDLTDAGATTLHKHDHGGMDGLADDDHTRYAEHAATETISASWTFSANQLFSGTTQLQFGDSATYIRQDADTILGLHADGYVRIGSTASTHSLGADGDLVVSGKLEVDGLAHFDESTYHYNEANIYDYLSIIETAAGTTYGGIRPYTDDGLHLGLSPLTGRGNRNLIIGDLNWNNKDYDHDTLSVDPTVFVHSATNPDTANDQWVSFSHDKTDAIYNVGTGAHHFQSGDVMIANILYVDNISSYTSSPSDGVAIDGVLCKDSILYAKELRSFEGSPSDPLWVGTTMRMEGPGRFEFRQSSEYFSSDAAGYLDAHFSDDDKGMRFYSGANLLLTVSRVNAANPTLTLLTAPAHLRITVGALSFMRMLENAYIQLDRPTITANPFKVYDNTEMRLGSGTAWSDADARIYYDATDLIIDPDVIGTGKVLIGATGDNDIWFANARVSSTGKIEWGDDGTYIHQSADSILSYVADGSHQFTGDVWVNKLKLPTTTSTVGILEINGVRHFHAYGDSNIFVGYGAGNYTLTGNSNVAVGRGALVALTSGTHNIAIGRGAAFSVTGGTHNIAIGFNAYGLGTGIQNVMIGSYCGDAALTGSANVGLGYQACSALTSGIRNMGIGTNSLTSTSTGNRNVGIGHAAGFSSNGDDNVFIGHQAGYYETGSSKFFIDNVLRTDEADGRVKALIYGVFAAATADQKVTLNSTLDVRENALMISTARWQFGDAGTYIHQSADSILSYVADGYHSFTGDTTFADVVYIKGELRLFQAGDYLTFGAVANGTLGWDADKDQLLLGLGAAIGRQFVIGEVAYRTKDYDHAVQTNPTLYVQSATDPDTDNTQYGSFAHDQTDFLYDVGKGDHVFKTGDVRIEETLYVDTIMSFSSSPGDTVLVDSSLLVNEALYVDSIYSYSSSPGDLLDIFAGVRIGDDARTNYLDISADGDLLFCGSAGLAFGEIWVVGNSTETVIAVAGTFVQFTGFDTNGQSNNATPDHTNDHITITKAGRYLIVCSFSIESTGGGAADTVSIEIRKNNGGTSLSNLHEHRKLAGGGGDVGSVSVSGMADLSVDDTIEVWITNDDNATDILVVDADMALVQMGGT